MNNKKLFYLVLALMLLALSVRAEAQQAKKVPRIGYLSSGDPASDSTRAETIRRGLRDLGHIEGQNISTEYRYAQGKREPTKFELVINLKTAKQIGLTIPPSVSGG